MIVDMPSVTHKIFEHFLRIQLPSLEILQSKSPFDCEWAYLGLSRIS